MRLARFGGVPALALATVLACASGPAAGVEDDPVELGHRIVQDHCASCHAVERVGDSPLPIAPPFRELHERYDVELLSEALVEGISTAHPEMPQFVFEPQEAAAIIAYLKSLERH
jgi:mono/diheme cytochrome c family protein